MITTPSTPEGIAVSRLFSKLTPLPVPAILIAIGTNGLAQDNPSAAAPGAMVERVVDGDTGVVRLNGAAVKVRLIGVDAPEGPLYRESERRE